MEVRLLKTTPFPRNPYIYYCDFLIDSKYEVVGCMIAIHKTKGLRLYAPKGTRAQDGVPFTTVRMQEDLWQEFIKKGLDEFAKAAMAYKAPKPEKKKKEKKKDAMD